MPGEDFSNSSKLVDGRPDEPTKQANERRGSVVWSTGMAWVGWLWFEVKACWLHARTHALARSLTHSLAASLANKKRVQRAIRRPTIRAAQSQRVGWSAFPLSPKICNQPSHPSGPPPPSLNPFPRATTDHRFSPSPSIFSHSHHHLVSLRYPSLRYSDRNHNKNG